MYKLVPYPKQIKCTKNRVEVALEASYCSSDLVEDVSITFLLEKLGSKASEDCCLQNYTLMFGNASTIEPLKREGAYAIKIDANGIGITANDRQGMIYALTTLRQIIDNEKGFFECEIVDYPLIGIRGHFDDVSRKRISTLQGFKENIERLAYFKVNYYALYIEDVLHLKAFPDIGEGRGKLMPWEVKELVEYARLNGVQLMPFFQMIGHCENMLELSNYEGLARKVSQHPSSLDPKNQKVRDYLEKALKEVVELFDCKYIGMGFDETQGVDCEEYIQHANFCADLLKQYGRYGVIWVDMFHNHFGIEKISRLRDNLIPCNWQYGFEGGKVPYHDEFAEVANKTNQRLFGFGGYTNWCKFVPVFEATKNHMDVWSATVVEKAPYIDEFGMDSYAQFYSQWGDNGYENNRDLVWNLYAYSGETSWNGGQTKELRDSFENRFQTLFYGREFGALTELVQRLERDTCFDAAFYWQKHRFTYPALKRYAVAEPDKRASFEHDLAIHKDYEERLSAIIPEKNATVINHFLVGIRLTIGVINRIISGYEALDEVGIREIVDEIIDLKMQYLHDWLSNNKYENVEVSLKVFDKVLASYQELISDVNFDGDYLMLDMQEDYDTMFLDVAGIPLGKRFYNAIPFSFADESKTHISLKSGCTVEYSFRRVQATDAHIICTVPLPTDLLPREVLMIRFYDGDRIVYEECLHSVTEVIDWFAPMGEHIWAGGGFRYANKDRVRLACQPGDPFGLMEVSKFDLPEGAYIDRIGLTGLTEADLCIFAMTLECR